MHVGLNALDFFPARMGGIETYFRNLLGALQDLPADGTRFTLLCLRPLAGELPLRAAGFTAREFAAGRPSAGWAARRLLQKTTGIDLLAGPVNRLALDVVHHPFTTINTAGLRAKAVVTFHDMQHEFLPELFTPAERELRRRAYLPSARAAARVIAISQHVKGTLVERYGLDPARVDVVYQGHGPAFRPVDDPARLARLRERYGLDRPYLYYPAASWPHKNHATLLVAFRLILDRRQFDGDLVLTGISRGAAPAIAAAIARLGLVDRVRLLGYVDAAELPVLYAAADVLVFPSLFEGFGIPLVEAMAVGCPVACSNTTSLPEITGDAALRFDPRSPEDMAHQVGRLAGDHVLRASLRAAGLARVAAFSWDRAARETVDVYRRAAQAN